MGSVKRGFVGFRLGDSGRAQVQAIADREHGGNLSQTIRALLIEALTARTAVTARQG